jgi:hypothetical protein
MAGMSRKPLSKMKRNEAKPKIKYQNAKCKIDEVLAA